MGEGPRIYNLFPTLAGTVTQWKTELPRIARMGFNWVFLNPFHYPGFSGSLYAVKDHYALNPRFRADGDDDEVLREFTAAARAEGLELMMDLVINHTAKDALLVDAHPEWFIREADGSVRSPRAVDPDDASRVTVWGDLAEIDYTPRPARNDIVSYWQGVVRHYAGLGFRGFRCDAGYKVPAEVWAPIIASARTVDPEAMFAVETLGCRLDEVEQLAPAGFDYMFNSSKWWDFESPWLLEQYQAFRHIAPSIAFPESHDTERLGAELARQGIEDDAEVEAVYRQRYLFAAVFSTGVMIPMGYEYGWQRKLDVVETTPESREPPRFDLGDFITDVNRLKTGLPTLNEEGPQERLAVDGAVGLLREARNGGEWVLSLVNPGGRPAIVRGEELDALLQEAEEITPWVDEGSDHDDARRLAPYGVRVFRGIRAEEHAVGSRMDSSGTGAGHPIVISGVYPELDCGRYPVKREVGDILEVWANIFREGHDQISATLLYRRAGSPVWRKTPMVCEEPGLDRWRGSLPLNDNGRYLYTIEAWPDPFASWRAAVSAKRDAKQDISVELIEGRALLEASTARATEDDRVRLERAFAEFDAADNDAQRLEILLSEPVREAMARCPDRSEVLRYCRVLEVVVDRERARFAAWYEMFPRSQGTEAGRSATFADCERRLPEIAEMGFDVIYLPPIHPIGRTHRKGANNVLMAGPDEPGSPYAIGAEEGGHTAVHPELGTLEDFRRFVRAAEKLGMEVALDFAIQCSPDHPWVREHPEWFRFRPDGTIKYAENPPKKYQDIVNVDFYGPGRAALWETLRDVVLFWIGQGVRTFRVDNPHTKPFPFWEWLIREVQDEYPDVVFLSEAFTRPRVLEQLAKLGFSQSYTYFTWRTFKGELADYLEELTQGPPSEYLRPNFFANTPDIMPVFLQTGGRPAFQIRLVLAATLSSLYGIYNGFELCENEAVPGTEEYLHSEKYQYKVWDWDRPGNIKDYIARVNGIRRANPALHELLNLRFHHATDDNVLFYSKMTLRRDNIVLVAVNLDPFEAHESELELPLTDIGMSENAPFEVEELLGGEKHLWRGAHQHLRLDPSENPAAIFRVTPWTQVDYRETCF